MSVCFLFVVSCTTHQHIPTHTALNTSHCATPQQGVTRKDVSVNRRVCGVQKKRGYVVWFVFVRTRTCMSCFCLCVLVNRCVNLYVCVRLCISICSLLSLYLLASLISFLLSLYLCIYQNMYLHVYVKMYVHVLYVCMYVHVNVRVYLYGHNTTATEKE